MLCHNCGNEIQLGQRTCGVCGSADEPTPPRDKPAVFIVIEQTEVVAPPSEPLATPDRKSLRQQRAAHQSFASVAALATGAVAPGSDPCPNASFGSGDAMWSGSVLLAIVAAVAGVAAIAGSFMLVSTITTDAPIPLYVGDYQLNDLGGGTNFQVAFILSGALMLAGALVVTRGGAGQGGERFGAGLIGGACLALVPLVAFMSASADAIADRALINAESISSAGGGGQVFESRLGIGFFVLIGAGVIGLIALLIALGRSATDGREPLETTLCVVGAVACLVAAAGQLIPERGSRFVDNFSNQFASSPLVYSRVGMIAVVAIGGIIGFLHASRFGLGLAIGSVSTYVWQWVTSVLGVGAFPAPPALGNPGSIDSAKPHIVTTVGVVAMVLIGCVMALIASRPDPNNRYPNSRYPNSPSPTSPNPINEVT